jgi:hypothetical protein
MEMDVLIFETWHQCLAHCSEKRLRQTQQRVDGIPKLHAATIPHMVTCRTCDIAKLQKAPRGPLADPGDCLHVGQVFHMNIGFIRGPSNVVVIVEGTQDALPKVIESCQGMCATCWFWTAHLVTP